MCETMESSHRLCPAMTLVRALLAPTSSDDGAGPVYVSVLCVTAAFASLFRGMS
jgi:hypothetical protein